LAFDFEDGSCDLEDYVALAEELTGVQVTPDMLEDSTYSTGIVRKRVAAAKATPAR
jgi:hypothetical protein